jgi:hypothetical protein
MTVPAYLNARNIAKFNCPACNKAYTRNLSKAANIGHGTKLRCRCTCEHTFVINLERRRHYRKPTEITGGYLHERHQYRGMFTIKNISRSGAGIELHTAREVNEGESLLLKFNLDDEEKTYIAKEAVIRKKDGKYIGVEFLAQTWDGDPVTTYVKRKK